MSLEKRLYYGCEKRTNYLSLHINTKESRMHRKRLHDNSFAFECSKIGNQYDMARSPVCTSILNSVLRAPSGLEAPKMGVHYISTKKWVILNTKGLGYKVRRRTPPPLPLPITIHTSERTWGETCDLTTVADLELDDTAPFPP